MQTFIIDKDFRKTAVFLDRLRLGKQRVECLQLLRALSGETKGWVNHPAAKMWKGHEYYLAMYGIAICDEWIKRGYKDTCRDKISAYLDKFIDSTYPTWLDGRFINSHKSNLLRKNPDHYSKFSWNVPSNLEYIWPNNAKNITV